MMRGIEDKMKNLLCVLCITLNLTANGSFYTSTKEEVITEREHGVEVTLTSPEEYEVIISDAGCMLMQLEVAGYLFDTAQVPEVIEWRINKKKKIIGAIVRTYIPIYDELKAFSEHKYSSQLNVLKFAKEVELIGVTSNNEDARRLLDEKGVKK